MTAARRLALTVLLAVAVLTVSAIVLARNVTPDDDLLATVGILGGLAILLAALPDR